MTHFKICGLCRPADAAAAAAAGASYAGVILTPGQRRSQTDQGAASIFAAAGGAKRVGVFVNPVSAAAIEAVRALDLDVVQLHGDEPPALAQELMGHAQVWKAVRVRGSADIEAAIARYGDSVSGLLLDGYSDAAAGGTGTRFDWANAIDARRGIPSPLTVVLAGGLRPDNVAAAIDALRPDVVDVSSGVEQQLCEKSTDLIQSFARAVDAARSLPVR